MAINLRSPKPLLIFMKRLVNGELWPFPSLSASLCGPDVAEKGGGPC